MGEYKTKNGTTRVGDLLRNMGDIGKPLLQAAGSLTGQPWLNAIANSITTSKELSVEQKAVSFELINLDMVDIADARKMQRAALEQGDVFAKRFVYYLALGIMGFAGLCVVMLFFVKIPEQNRDFINFALGVILGTGFASVVTFFFGSSKSSQDKTDLMKKIG